MLRTTHPCRKFSCLNYRIKVQTLPKTMSQNIWFHFLFLLGVTILRIRNFEFSAKYRSVVFCAETPRFPFRKWIYDVLDFLHRCCVVTIKVLFVLIFMKLGIYYGFKLSRALNYFIQMISLKSKFHRFLWSCHIAGVPMLKISVLLDFQYLWKNKTSIKMFLIRFWY